MATSIKLPEELTRRIARVVKDTPFSAHAFMVEAIRQETERAERRREFIAGALASRDRASRSGLAYAWEDVDAYLRARLQGKRTRRPRLKSWRK